MSGSRRRTRAPSPCTTCARSWRPPRVPLAVREDDVEQFRNGVLEVLSTINARQLEIVHTLARIEAKVDAVQTVVVDNAEELSTLRSRVIEQASRDGQERQQQQQRQVQAIECRLPTIGIRELDSVERRIRENGCVHGRGRRLVGEHRRAPRRGRARAGSKPDSNAPSPGNQPKCLKTVGSIVGALMTLTGIAEVIWDATNRRSHLREANRGVQSDTGVLATIGVTGASSRGRAKLSTGCPEDLNILCGSREQPCVWLQPDAISSGTQATVENLARYQNLSTSA